MVKVNGEMLPLDGKTAAEMLDSLGYSQLRVAVEVNSEILPKSRYGELVLRDGDSVEIVGFVGGG